MKALSQGRKLGLGFTWRFRLEGQIPKKVGDEGVRGELWERGKSY